MNKPSGLNIGQVVQSIGDVQLAMHLLLIEKGFYTVEECDRMIRIVEDAKRRIGGMSLKEAMNIIRASYRIESPKEQKNP